MTQQAHKRGPAATPPVQRHANALETCLEKLVERADALMKADARPGMKDMLGADRKELIRTITEVKRIRTAAGGIEQLVDVLEQRAKAEREADVRPQRRTAEAEQAVA